MYLLAVAVAFTLLAAADAALACSHPGEMFEPIDERPVQSQRRRKAGPNRQSDGDSEDGWQVRLLYTQATLQPSLLQDEGYYYASQSPGPYYPPAQVFQQQQWQQ